MGFEHRGVGMKHSNILIKEEKNKARYIDFYDKIMLANKIVELRLFI